jgi:hypothetical protein
MARRGVEPTIDHAQSRVRVSFKALEKPMGLCKRGRPCTTSGTAPPSVIPVEMCNLGWQESLAHLVTQVEPVIPD